jgi:hypothetical protein
MCNVGPTVLAFGMGFADEMNRDMRAESFRDAMRDQVEAKRIQIFDVQHVGGWCSFFGHQICGVVCEDLPDGAAAILGAGVVMQ